MQRDDDTRNTAPVTVIAVGGINNTCTYSFVLLVTRMWIHHDVTSYHVVGTSGYMAHRMMVFREYWRSVVHTRQYSFVLLVAWTWVYHDITILLAADIWDTEQWYLHQLGQPIGWEKVKRYYCCWLNERLYRTLITHRGKARKLITAAQRGWCFVYQSGGRQRYF